MLTDTGMWVSIVILIELALDTFICCYVEIRSGRWACYAGLCAFLIERFCRWARCGRMSTCFNFVELIDKSFEVSVINEIVLVWRGDILSCDTFLCCIIKILTFATFMSFSLAQLGSFIQEISDRTMNFGDTCL